MKRLIPLLFLALIACKTRKTITDSAHVVKETSTEQQSQLHSSDSSKLVDTSVRTGETHAEVKAEAENTTEFYADSAVVITKPDGTIKTKYFIKGKVKTTGKSTSNKIVDNKSTTHKNIVKSTSQVLDSLSSSKNTTKSDSTVKHKATEAIGSGTEWPKWIGVGLIVAIVLLFLFKLITYKKEA